MSEKRYQRVCEQCEKPFVAKISYARFCDGKCKAQWHRDKKATDTTKIIQSQRTTIRTQATALRTFAPAPVKIKKASVATGKDLIECKRPDGSHLYTDQDLWILIARINQLVFNEQTGNLLSVLSTNESAETLIRDFEKRFDCRFDDVKRANPKVRPGSTDAENESLIIKYAELQYSR